MGDLSAKQFEIMQETLQQLIGFTSMQLDAFMQLVDEENKENCAAVFMNSVVHNYITNLIIKASDTKIDEIKINAKKFVEGFEDFFKHALPMIEKNLTDLQNKRRMN